MYYIYIYDGFQKLRIHFGEGLADIRKPYRNKVTLVNNCKNDIGVPPI